MRESDQEECLMDVRELLVPHRPGPGPVFVSAAFNASR